VPVRIAHSVSRDGVVVVVLVAEPMVMAMRSWYFDAFFDPAAHAGEIPQLWWKFAAEIVSSQRVCHYYFHRGICDVVRLILRHLYVLLC